MVRGPSAGLELLNALDEDGRLGHHRLDAVRAHLLEMSGDHPAAIAHYRIAADRTTSLPERNYLMTQAAGLSESATSPASDDAARAPAPEQTAALPGGAVPYADFERWHSA